MNLRTSLLTLAVAASLFSSPTMAGLDEGARAMREGQYREAFREWKPLAEQGNVDAQASIAVMYHAGRGVPRDFRQAFAWYRRAAEQGSAASQANLALMYSRGLGVAADEVMAYVWYDLATAGGEARHRRARDRVAGRLSAAQLKKAKRLSRQYSQKYVTPFRRGAAG